MPNIYNATIGFWLIRRGIKTENYWIVGVGIPQVLAVFFYAFFTACGLVSRYTDFGKGTHILLNLLGYANLPFWIEGPLVLASGIGVLLIGYLFSGS